MGRYIAEDNSSRDVTSVTDREHDDDYTIVEGNKGDSLWVVQDTDDGYWLAYQEIVGGPIILYPATGSPYPT
jgi:hypothetical protein